MTIRSITVSRDVESLRFLYFGQDLKFEVHFDLYFHHIQRGQPYTIGNASDTNLTAKTFPFHPKIKSKLNANYAIIAM